MLTDWWRRGNRECSKDAGWDGCFAIRHEYAKMLAQYQFTVQRKGNC